VIRFRVNGMPAPQGSKSAFALRKAGRYTGRAVVVDDNSDSLRRWRGEVAAEARVTLAPTEHGHAPDGPMAVTIMFILPRPLGHYGTGANRGALKPGAPARPCGRRLDLDKLARSTLDALTGIAWADDGQVADLDLAKVYQASPAEQPGAVIEIRTIGEDA